MKVFDASAILALFFAEPAEDEVANLLSDGKCGIPGTAIAEVVDRAARRRGVPVDSVVAQVDALLGQSLSVIAIDAAIGKRAGRLRAEHYDRSTSPLSLSDCVLVACASARDSVVTSDRALATMARAEGLQVTGMRDSKGNRPGF